MKLILNGKEQDVDFVSFMKCTFLASLVIAAIISGIMFVIGLYLLAYM
jgi:hypothetical protein